MSNQELLLDYIEVEQSVGTFYTTVLPAKSLLEICKFDFRQIKENNGIKDFLGIQRPLNEVRVKEIQKYIGTLDGCFPTSIVISVDELCASFTVVDGVKKLRLAAYTNPETKEVGIEFDSLARIIDGQHRLKAFDGIAANWDLSVNIFVGIDEGTQAMIFSKVNLAQTKVNKSLVYDLFSLDKGRSPEKTCHEIVVNLNDMPQSPFNGLIKRLGSATDGVFGETLSQATIVKGLLPLITNDPLTDRDIGKRWGSWPERGQKDFEKRPFYPFFQMKVDYKILAVLINYFGAMQERWPDAWANTGRGAILSRTNGYNASIRFLRDAYLYLTNVPTVPSKDEFLKIFNRSKLSDKDFTVDNFAPGSSGASALYKELISLVKIDEA